MKWVVELGQFEIRYKRYSTIKAHALADFVVELSYVSTPEEQS